MKNINLDLKNSPSIEVFKKDLKTYLFKKVYKKYLNWSTFILMDL